MSHRIFALFLASTSLLASCSVTPGVEPIEDSAALTKTYIQAKNEYVIALQDALIDPTKSKYRLVAVVGPQWKIGAVIDPENPLNNFTDNCLVKDDELPTPTPWASLPGFTSTKTITLGAGLPSKVTELLGKSSAVGANLTSGKNGQFGLSELASVIVAEDAFSKSFSDDCKAVLGLRGGLVVRGVVTGKEVFKSDASLVTGASIKVAETDLLKLQYDDKGTFELEDKTVNPKMFLITQFIPQDKGDGDVQVVPSAATIARVEALDKNKP